MYIFHLPGEPERQDKTIHSGRGEGPGRLRIHGKTEGGKTVFRRGPQHLHLGRNTCILAFHELTKISIN